MAMGAASKGQSEPKKSKPAKAHKLRSAVPPVKQAKKKSGLVSKLLGKNKKG